MHLSRPEACTCSVTLNSSAPVLGPLPGHPLPRWCGRAPSATMHKGGIYGCQKTIWNSLGDIHATTPPQTTEGQPSPEAGTSGPPTHGFPWPGDIHSSPCFFPESTLGPERDIDMPAVTQQGVARFQVQPSHSSSHIREVEALSFSLPLGLHPCLHFILQGREGGSEAWPLRVLCPPSRRSWEGILHPTAPRRHRRIKDRWITANEPACTINTGEPSRG